MVSRARAPSANAALWILAVLATLFFLRTARSLLIPIALGVLLTYALAPVVEWLQRRRIPRLAGAALVMLIILGGIAGGGYLLRDDAKQLVEAVPRAVERAQTMVSSQLGIDSGARPVGTAGDMPGPPLERAASAVFSAGGHAVAVFFLIFFLLISGPLMRDRLVEISGPDRERRETTARIISDINGQVQRYLLVLVVTGAIVGAATWMVLTWMGVENALLWGLLAGVFNSIPYFGPVIVCGGLFAVGLAQGGDMTQALQMAGAALVITSLEGWLLTPALMGKAEHMNALTVFVGLLLWTWLWGGWGTILAVPMLVVVKSVADHVDRLKPVGRLMAP